MSALRDWDDVQFTNHGGTAWVRLDAAESRIAALEADNARLRSCIAAEMEGCSLDDDCDDCTCRGTCNLYQTLHRVQP